MQESQAINMSKTFDHILTEIIEENPEKAISDIEFFGDHSQKQVMSWNSTMPQKVDRCIHSIIDEQKIGRPASTPAIAAWDGDLTYQELERVTNKLAAYLTSCGVGPEIYVPLCFEKSIYTVISMVSVMKAGGAFVPLDPSHPTARIKHFIDDVGAKTVLCSELYRNKIEGAVEQTLVVNKELIEGLETVTFVSTVMPSNPAYIIFVSIPIPLRSTE